MKNNAYYIFNDINNDKYTEQEKLAAITSVLDMETHNSITKDSIIKAFKWFINSEPVEFQMNPLRMEKMKNKGDEKMAEKNCELELYKLIMEGASCGFPYVSEFGWVNDTQFLIWVDYLWLKEFIDKMIEIFGDAIFNDGNFNAIMLSRTVCIDLADVLDEFVDIEEVFPKEDYKH